MGRAGGPPSVRSGDRSKKIGQSRTKRKKRKRDLEELHRNVLEAKRCARIGATQYRTKRKTNFAKVLSNFADKRRDNEEGKETLGDGKSTRKKSRRICERLLPKPMVGIYQNGSKGREIRRAADRLNEMNVARLRGNVLKLLKGDETNVKSSWEREKDGKKARANPDRPLDDSDELDCQIVKCRRVKDGPFLGNTKGVAVVKRANHESLRTTKVRDEETSTIETKNETNELSPRQRDEDKCRRRLFEPDDDENEPTKNNFGIIDRPMITDHEIRFSPGRIERVPYTKKILDDGHAERTLPRNEQFRNDEDDETQRNRGINRASMNANFWGRSPVTCYERLCAEISIHNFENKHYHRQRDPVVKRQNILRGLFIQNGRDLRDKPKKLSKKHQESGSVISWKTIGGSNSEDEIYPAFTGNSEMEQCSSPDSSVTMIGSWHPENSQRHRSNDDTTSVFEDKSEQGLSRCKRTRKHRGTEPESPVNENKKNVVASSGDVEEKSINSVSAFFKQFQDHNPLVNRRERNVFEMEIDRDSRTSDEKLDVCLKTPPRHAKFPDAPKCAPRKNTIKHVPAILRRTAEHSERMDQDENPRGFLPPKLAQNIPTQRIPDDENFIFSTHEPFPARERGARSFDDMTVSPCATSILREPNYYHYRTPARATGKKLAEQRQLDRANARKSKLNFTRANNNENRRLPYSEDREGEGSRGNDYKDAPLDRQVELTRRDFTKIVNTNNPTSKNRSFCQNQLEIMDFQSDPKHQNEGNTEQAISGKRVTFFNESDGFFDPSEWKNAEKFELDGQRRNNHRDAIIKTAEKTLGDHPCVHQPNNLNDDARFPSFEFPPLEVERRSSRSNDPKNLTAKKLLPRTLQDSILPISQVRNTTESSLGLGNDDTMSRPRPLIVNGPGASMWQYADLESINSEQPVQGLSNLRTMGNQWPVCSNPPPTDRPNGGSVHEQQRAISRRPVVLFRPIEHPRQRGILQSQNPDPRNHDNPETTATRAAVRNLRVMAFEDNIPEEGPSLRPHHACYQQGQQRSSPPRCNRQSFTEGHSSNQLNHKNFEPYAQPAKFLAYERTDGGNPGRIPIYGKFYVPNVPARKSSKHDASELLANTDERAQGTGSLYVSSLQVAGPSNEQKPASGPRVERTTGSFILTAGRSYVYDNDSTVLVHSESELSGTERQRARRVALMMPLPALRYHQSSKIAPPIVSPTEALQRAVSNEMPATGIVYSLDDRGRLVRPAQLRYELVEPPAPVTAPTTANGLQNQCEANVNFCGRPFTEAATLPERIQLPDGRIGLLLAENSTIGNPSQRFDANTRPTLNVPSRINGRDSIMDARCLYEFANNDGIRYSQPDRCRNTGYDANEAYRRLARANGVPDTFTGI